jgi:prepilin-type N-terminal cleavage/methylation domain-containing protein
MSYRNNKGFSLIELMVVLVIVGILAALMIPNVAGFISNMEINEAAQNVAGALRTAKEIAITKNVRTVVWISENNRDYTLYRQPMFAGELNSPDTIVVNGITLYAIDTRPISVKGNIGMQTKATGNRPDGSGGISVQQSLKVEFFPKGSADQLNTGDTTIYLMSDVDFARNKTSGMRAITVSAATGRARIYQWGGSSWQ